MKTNEHYSRETGGTRTNYDPAKQIDAGRPRLVRDRGVYRLAIRDTSGGNSYGYSLALVRLTLPPGEHDWTFAEAETLLGTVLAWDNDGKFHTVFCRAEFSRLTH